MRTLFALALLFLPLWTVVHADPFHLFTAEELAELDDADIFFRSFEKTSDKETLIDYSADLQHFQVFRERDFYTADYVTTVATTEYRHGWTYLAQVIIDVAKAIRPHTDKYVPTFKNIFDPRITRIWSDHPKGLADLKKKSPTLMKAVFKELDRLRTNGTATHRRRVHEWKDFVTSHYKKFRGWTDKLETYLDETMMADRGISKWGVVHERKKNTGRGGRAKGKVLGTIMKSTSKYMRFLVRRRGSVAGAHSYRSFVCKHGQCDIGNLLRPKSDGGAYGIEMAPPDKLALERLFKLNLPRGVEIILKPEEAQVLLESGNYEIVYAGEGEISEDRCFAFNAFTPAAYQKMFGDTWVHLQFFMSEPGDDRDSVKYHRNFAYMPKDDGQESKSHDLYEGLGLLEEVYPPLPVDWGDFVEEMEIFSFGANRIADIIRNPAKYRRVFKNVDPRILVDHFIRLWEYERRGGLNIQQYHRERSAFLTRRRIRKYLKFLRDEGVLRDSRYFASSNPFSEEITKKLREQKELVKHFPDITAARFYRYVIWEYSDDLVVPRSQIFKVALADANIDWRDVYEFRRLSEEAAELAFRHIAFNYPTVDLNGVGFLSGLTEDLVKEAIYEVTGAVKTPQRFKQEIAEIDDEGWYGFHWRAGLKAESFRSELKFETEELNRVIIAIVEREGEFSRWRVHQGQAQYQKIIREVLPERRRAFCTVGRLLTAFDDTYGSNEAVQGILKDEIAEATRKYQEAKFSTCSSKPLQTKEEYAEAHGYPRPIEGTMTPRLIDLNHDYSRYLKRDTELRKTELDAVIVGVVERYGEFSLERMLNAPTLLQHLMKEILPRRVAHTCTAERFKSAFATHYKSMGAMKSALKRRIEQARRFYDARELTRPPEREKKTGRGPKIGTTALTNRKGKINIYGIARLKRSIRVFSGEIAMDVEKRTLLEALGKVLLERKHKPFDLVRSDTTLEACRAEVESALGRNVSGDEVKELARELNLRWLKRETNDGPAKFYTRERIRFILWDLDRRGKLKIPEEMLDDEWVNNYIQGLDGAPAGTNFNALYKALTSLYNPIRESLGFTSRNDTFKAALVDADVEWRSYFPNRRLDFWEIVTLIRYIATHHKDEIELTHEGIKSADPQLLEEITMKAVLAKRSGKNLHRDIELEFGSVYRAVFITGYDPADFGTPASFNPDEEATMLRELVGNLSSEAPKIAKYPISDIIREYLFKNAIMPQEIMESDSAMAQLVAHVSREQGREVDARELQPYVMNFHHRLNPAFHGSRSCPSVLLEAAA